MDGRMARMVANPRTHAAYRALSPSPSRRDCRRASSTIAATLARPRRMPSFSGSQHFPAKTPSTHRGSSFANSPLAAAMASATISCALATSAAAAGAVGTASRRHGAAARPSSNAAFVNSDLFSTSKAALRAAGASTTRPVSWCRASVLTVCKISKGDVVPPVGLKDQDGKLVNLDKFRGKPLVLYFYPADETPGCTKQACAFRDSYEKFRKAGAEVVGVSGDTPESHKAFKAKYRLPFTLLSDEGNKLRKDWGVPSDLFGALAGRQTYVIDKDGKVKLIFNNQFEPEKHIVETLNVLQG